MTQIDLHRGRPTGATPAALPLYESALDGFVSWRSGAHALLARATAQAPRFVMAHVLKAWMLAGGRDRRQLDAARAQIGLATALPADDHERLHLAALACVLADDYDGAAARLGTALESRPRDLLALATACGIDYLMGQTARMRERVQRVLPAWPRDVPGFHSVQAMHAFSLVECGEVEHAEDAALAALALDAHDARAHHAMAHVFEMGDRPDGGVRWMNEHAPQWAERTAVATHGWWHLALFHLTRGEPEAALALYDRRIAIAASTEIADLIDATALLWRLHLRGVETGDHDARWRTLADAWEPHIDDGFCSFSDVHAMLAFVGACDGARARRLEAVLAQRQSQPTRHGLSTRQLGLPACRGLMAFGRGEHALAITMLASVPQRVHELGGSHAQRDVLHLTLLHAIGHIRRPTRAARAARTAQHTKHPQPVHEARLAHPLPNLVAV